MKDREMEKERADEWIQGGREKGREREREGERKGGREKGRELQLND